MPVFLAPLLARFLGLPKWLRQALAIAVAALALWGAVTLYLGHVRREAVRDFKADQEAAAAPAHSAAAEERATDTATNAVNERDLHHAIDAAPTGGTLSPAALALSCERLRKLGRFPAACRSQGSR